MLGVGLLAGCGDRPLATERGTAVARVAQPAAFEHVKVNEVESNQGTPGDWVELANTGAEPVDLSGYVFRDNDGTRGYVIPAGTVIPGNGYLVLDEAQFDFGLGAADQARLFAPDGTTLVDSYAWTAHAATTYGRCPDGTGPFATTSLVTKGVANDCSVLVRINEVESDGGVPGDWVELYNPGGADVSLAGYVFRDADDARDVVLPAGTAIPANGHLVLDAEALGFDLGPADAARLFRPNGTTLVDGYAWAAHAATTYGRCPSGTGGFVTTAAPTRGVANSCPVATTTVAVNEVESNGGTPGDWVELYNSAAAPVDLSGYVLRDNDDTRSYTLPAGTVIAAGGYLVLDESQFDFGLGAADAARLFAPGGVTLVDGYAWTAHAATTYGRCPDGSGAFATTAAPTKGAANGCGGGGGGGETYAPWPGDPGVSTADAGRVFGGNMSGLVYQASGIAAPGTLWAVRNGPGALFRLTWTNGVWAPNFANGWAAGRALRYPDGTGDVDAEGVTLVGAAIYVAAERNNAANGVSRLSILRYDTAAAAATAADVSLRATREWNLTADLPAVGPNLGLEGITWVPDAYLTARGFVDEGRGAPYDPAAYPGHGDGLFFVGVEAGGTVYAYALDHATGAFARVATIASGFPGVMELAFDRELAQLWAVCDDTCNGRTAVLAVDTQVGSPTRGRFVVARRFERPAGMPNLNNEGFAPAAQAECVGGRKPAFWADDAETGGFAIRRGTVSCAPS